MYPIPVAIAIVLDGEKILIGQRLNKEERYLYGFPGGKIDIGEPAQYAVIRELEEETGLIATRIPIFMGYCDAIIHNHYIYMYFLVPRYKGRVINKEPHKMLAWEWWHLRDVPTITNQTYGMRMFIQDIHDRLLRMPTHMNGYDADNAPAITKDQIHD